MLILIFLYLYLYAIDAYHQMVDINANSKVATSHHAIGHAQTTDSEQRARKPDIMP
jgi:hypothetical protein